MAADVNMRGHLPHKDNEKRRTSKGSRSPRKGKPASGNSGVTEHTRQPQLEESETGKKTSVFQGKVNALKEKKKELSASQFYREQGELPEDVLVNPQLRTYLTEEVLERGGQSTFHDDEREKRWGSSSRDDTAEHFSRTLSISSQGSHDTGSGMWPQDHLQTSSLDLSGTLQHSGNLSLAERVERNRQELRSKLHKPEGLSVETQHGPTPKRDSWMTHVEADGDSGVSLPVSESCGELSVRHEQAKQLLHRARMKAKGASPLRASHCVSIHSHSQPPLRRSRCASGAATDGGSLSDSSSSDYCSWNRGSRGTSPSHVRFQDESEREAEERYRERQQQGPQSPSANATPPLMRQSSGHVSGTQHLSPSGNEHCGTCGSYLNGSGANQVPGGTPQRTSGRNIQMGLRITQEGPLSCPLGTKPSPHWILPSQPWRIHTELIRETHIGEDSTANSSEEEDAIRSQSKNSPHCAARRNSRNTPLSASPRLGYTPYTPHQEIETSISSLKPVTENRMNEHPSMIGRATQNPPPWKPGPSGKTSESNLESQTNTRSNHRNQTVSQDVDCRSEIKPVGVAINSRKELSMLNPKNGNTLLNTDARECTNIGKIQTLNTASCTEQIFTSLGVGSAHGNLTVSGHN
ncbi:uncharacterized protein LOC128500948 [Spea bombifrons]|uniref:uncharacterized protein LOC128500948 n=1 Tax=Spea bombifrons TaxID=233779 RepID=UPI00234B0752|nr:uncharacterized protein LOC128500948 [Spea bombifrons]